MAGDYERFAQTEGDLQGIRVLVTGATTGLGRAMAEALAKAGARVAITSRDEDRAVAAAAKLPNAYGLALDVRQEASVSRCVAQVIERLDGLEVLVNNAGIGMRTVNPHFMSDPQPFWKVTPAGFRDLIETNLTGYFLMAREVVPHFVQAKGGRIVNISMNHQTMRRRGFVPYGPSRAGAESLSHIMAADLDGTGITVNMLLPGAATATGMIPDEANAEMRSRLLPADIMGPPIRWLCSRAADGVSGQRIVATEFEVWLTRRTTVAG